MIRPEQCQYDKHEICPLDNNKFTPFCDHHLVIYGHEDACLVASCIDLHLDDDVYCSTHRSRVELNNSVGIPTYFSHKTRHPGELAAAKADLQKAKDELAKGKPTEPTPAEEFDAVAEQDTEQPRRRLRRRKEQTQ